MLRSASRIRLFDTEGAMEYPEEHSEECRYRNPSLTLLPEGYVVSARCPFCGHSGSLERGYYCGCGLAGGSACSCRGMVIACCKGAIAWYEQQAAEKRAREDALREQSVRERIRELIEASLAGRARARLSFYPISVMLFACACP